MITAIDNGAEVGQTKVVTQASGKLFSAFLRQQGFDGLIAIEGGEGHIGVHHSYVLFDPAQARIRSEKDVSAPTMTTRPDLPEAAVTQGRDRDQIKSAAPPPTEINGMVESTTSLIDAAFPHGATFMHTNHIVPVEPSGNQRPDSAVQPDLGL
ncbi:hypothetical protein [Nocardia carnea]|uniref:hypothetical protein n=1 Tax=Nocardia carnea TaxID=37328 RepID=UPI002456196F|nr:hypothetical protein [Nocardia carnea]